MSAAIIKTEASQKRRNFVSKFLIYFFLIVITACMLLPFLWMLSSSFKLNKDVFGFPIQWIPKNPRWQNYVDIWTQIPLLTFVKNTVKITVVVTLLQLFTSSFAAYAFAKMQFKGKNALFLGYIATIAVPWQAYMVPQFMMMSSWHLNNTHLAIMCLQAFSAFGVFLMKQFYEGVPTELCEAARIDGLSEYGIWWHIMLPLSLPALSTLTIFTFVNTWNDFLGPLIYLTKTELKTIQIGLRMFITQYSAEYGLIMAASVVALIPVLIVFLSLQKYFVQGVGLLAKKNSYPRELSGGQKQRVAIVRALCMHPEILLFDEVTAALDPEMVREVLDVMLDLAKQGKTMIIVTHEMQFARAIANRVIFLDGGKIVEEAAPAEFFERPKTERAQRFLRTFTFDAVK